MTMSRTLKAALLLGVAACAAAARAEEQVTTPTIVIVGKTESGYKISNSSTGTKTDTPILETPASVEAVSSEVIHDQAAIRIKDALENVSGVRPQSTLGEGSGFVIRGFRDNRIYRNGIIANAANDQFDSDFGTANIESVEVLKGPASILFGRIEPGGLINIVTKRPLPDTHYSIQQTFGSYDEKRTEWDATGPASSDGTLFYRFTGSYDDGASFRDFNFHREMLFAPSLTWKPSSRLEFNLEIEGYNKDYLADFGIPAIGNRPAPIPIGRNLGDPNTPPSYLSKVHVGSDVVYRVSDDWSLHSRFLSTITRAEQSFLNPAPSFIPTALEADNRTLDRNAFFEGSNQDIAGANLDLTGKFAVGSTRHNALVGFDYLHSTTDYWITGDYLNPDPRLAIDIFSPHYGVDPAIIASTLAIPSNFSVYEGDWYGLYAQDQVTLWDRLHLVANGRYDWVTAGRSNGSSFADAATRLDASKHSDERFSPRLGILYEPIDRLSVYFSWSNSFGNNNGLDSVTGKPLPPELAEQYEAGVKTELFDGNLLATASVFELTKTNILGPDPHNPLISVLNGSRRARGVEMDITGRITDELNVIATYAYTDARVIDDTNGLEGDRVANVPHHAGSVWLKYDVKDYAPLKGLSLGLGAFLVGDRPGDGDQVGDPGNTFTLPAYARVDLLAAYQFSIDGTSMTAQFNIKNMFDKRYYESTDQGANVASRLGIYPGAPLTALGSLRAEF
jgi:iron complex outermembrane receptor protein